MAYINAHGYNPSQTLSQSIHHNTLTIVSLKTTHTKDNPVRLTIVAHDTSTDKFIRIIINNPTINDVKVNGASQGMVIPAMMNIPLDTYHDNGTAKNVIIKRAIFTGATRNYGRSVIFASRVRLVDLNNNGATIDITDGGTGVTLPGNTVNVAIGPATQKNYTVGREYGYDALGDASVFDWSALGDSELTLVNHSHKELLFLGTTAITITADGRRSYSTTMEDHKPFGLMLTGDNSYLGKAVPRANGNVVSASRLKAILDANGTRVTMNTTDASSTQFVLSIAPEHS